VPELPEVETLRRSLEPVLLGRTIAAVAVAEPRLRTRLVPARLRAALVGRSVEALERRSKYLLVHLSDATVLVLHLGMSGRLTFEPLAAPLGPHTHVRLSLAGGGELRYADPRRFGMLFVVARQQLDRHPRFRHLGPSLSAPASPSRISPNAPEAFANR
jgi:formamidopyrimidine-DNA glycosylase